MKTEAFKPYKHKGSIIYSPKNKEFLEGLADKLVYMPQSEKNKMHDRAVFTGGIHYRVIISGKGKVMLVSGNPLAGSKRGATIFLAEE